MHKMLERITVRKAILIALSSAMLTTLTHDSVENANSSCLESSDPDNGTVQDVDGNVYHYVTINNQLWMVENLRTTRYRDGTTIPSVEDVEAWSVLSTGAYCSPGADSSAQECYLGLLYNFYAVSDSCGLCPEGWHVPTAAEWRQLIDYLGGIDVAGGKMKDTSVGLWKVLVEGTTNESGFSALPAGGRGRLGSPSDVGYYATWWSSTSHDSSNAWHWGLYPDRHGIRSNPGHKASGFSVRCVKN